MNAKIVYRHFAYETILPTLTENLPMPTPPFPFPGVLNPKELLVAEAIQARALASLEAQGLLDGDERKAAKAKLGGIVLCLISDLTKSIGDFLAAAIASFTSF